LTDVKELPEDDRDKLKHVTDMTYCVCENFNFNIGSSVGFIV